MKSLVFNGFTALIAALFAYPSWSMMNEADDTSDISKPASASSSHNQGDQTQEILTILKEAIFEVSDETAISKLENYRLTVTNDILTMRIEQNLLEQFIASSSCKSFHAKTR